MLFSLLFVVIFGIMNYYCVELISFILINYNILFNYRLLLHTVGWFSRTSCTYKHICMHVHYVNTDLYRIHAHMTIMPNIWNWVIQYNLPCTFLLMINFECALPDYIYITFNEFGRSFKST